MVSYEDDDDDVVQVCRNDVRMELRTGVWQHCSILLGVARSTKTVDTVP